MTNLNHVCAHQLAAALKSGPQLITPASTARPSAWHADQFTPRHRTGRVLLPGSLMT